MEKQTIAQINTIANQFRTDYTETEHWYLHKDSGVRVPSVTTITSIVEKPAITKWKIREAVKAIIESHGDSVLSDDFDMAIEAAVSASSKIVEVAQIVGNRVHETIEEWFNKWIIDGKKPDISLVKLFDPNFVQDEVSHLKHDLTQTQIIAALRSAENYINKYEARPVALEINVGDVEHGYAGKLDALMEVDGELEIWDWKTSAFIPLTDPTYPMQINAYTAAFEKMSGLKINKMRIVQLSKSEDRFVMHEVERSKELLEAFYALSKFYDETRTRKHNYYKGVDRQP